MNVYFKAVDVSDVQPLPVEVGLFSSCTKSEGILHLLPDFRCQLLMGP